MVGSSFDVSISERATPERRRALISKSSRATVLVSARRLSGASSFAEATVCRSAPPVAGAGFRTLTCTALPYASLKAPSMTAMRSASTLPALPPPVL